MHHADPSQHRDWLQQGKEVLEIELRALEKVQAHLDESFIAAVETILSLQGRLVIVGMGKSGIIARKLAATFASTGTPAFFVHAAEAQHGDLGMITAHDAVLALSHSGETSEVCLLLPTIKRLGATIIAMTGNRESTLAQHADITLHIPISQEACPMNLAPTASTTAALALGDALAVVTLKHRGFKEEDFARVHPAGSLGRKLMRVCDIMHKGDALPLVTPTTPLREAILRMSSHRFGISGIVDNEHQLLGCLTDGDLRRLLESGTIDLNIAVETVMHRHPRIIDQGVLVSEALHFMELHKITVLFVIDRQEVLVGIVHLHDLLNAGAAA
ncbi:MAG: KpsF/GutQ family sugar-phosphate isomerase [Zetaproteobacteria bacterium]|nr:KpsF/GutQ family sugar-phosphate isomerase [Zetaproteobacteria bacterium]